MAGDAPSAPPNGRSSYHQRVDCYGHESTKASDPTKVEGLLGAMDKTQDIGGNEKGRQDRPLEGNREAEKG